MPLTIQRLERKVVELANLPTMPGVLELIRSSAQDANSTASDVAKMISSDQVLSAKVLRLVNSPVYGFPGRISSVTHAVVLLGFNVVKGLLMGTTVFDSMGKEGEGLWNHSLGCAIISRRIAQEAKIVEPEEVMVAGLLHDLGKVVLSVVCADEYATITATARETGTYIGEVEQAILGVTHAVVASWLAREWSLPNRLSASIQYHHMPEKATTAKDVTAVVHLADILTRGMGYGYSGDDTMPPFSREAFQSLGLSFAQIDKILESVEPEYAAGVAVFHQAD